MVKRVKITIKNGKIDADFIDFKGKACEALEQRIRLEEMDVEETELKPEHSLNTAQGEFETEHN